MRTPTIETERLILRPLTVDDAQNAFERWTTDPEVAKYMMYTAHKSIDETIGWMSTIDIDSDTAYDFAICAKDEDNYLFGSCGVYYCEDDQVFEVGYNLARDHWRKGYGTEVMQALVDFTVKQLHQTAIRGRYDIHNEVSGHVMKKCGFEYIGEGKGFKYDGVTPHDYYLLRYNVKGEKTDLKLYNGLSVAPIGFGTYMAEEGSVSKAIENGYRYFDTASFYMNEEMVGKEIKESGIPREEVFLASKIWPTEFGYKETYEAFERSVSKLGTDYLDLYLIHWPKLTKKDDQWKRKLSDTWKAMEELYKAGKIKAIGVSNFLPHHLKVIMDNFETKPMVNQLELHIGYMQQYTVDFCKANDIHVQAWSPMGRGRLNEDEFINSIARKYLVTPQKLMLRFLNQNGISVIPKTNDPVKMSQNLDIFGFTICDEDMSLLMALPQTGFSGEFADSVEFEGRM